MKKNIKEAKKGEEFGQAGPVHIRETALQASSVNGTDRDRGTSSALGGRQ